MTVALAVDGGSERVSPHWGDDGSFNFSGRLSPEDGAAFVAEIEARQRAVPEDPSPRPECSAEHHDARCSAEHLPAVARTLADALVALVHAAAAGVPGEGVGTEISVHVDDSTLRTGVGDCASSTTARPCRPRPPVASPATQRSWRSVRTPRACRGGCGAGPGVCRPRCGGPTELWNLVELCAFHHRLIHEGGWTLELGADGTVTVRDPAGNARVGAPSVDIDPADGGIEARNHASGERITPRTAIPNWYGDHLDLDHALFALLGNPGGPFHEWATRPARS